jgi:hypothetical protein
LTARLSREEERERERERERRGEERNFREKEDSLGARGGTETPAERRLGKEDKREREREQERDGSACLQRGEIKDKRA